MAKEIDMVNSPPHYQTKVGLQPVDVGEVFELCHHASSAIEYILRAERKGTEIEDYRKAVWWLQRKILSLKVKEPHIEVTQNPKMR